MKFLSLTLPDGKKILVNPDAIATVDVARGQSSLITLRHPAVYGESSYPHYISVEETVEDIERMLDEIGTKYTTIPADERWYGE